MYFDYSAAARCNYADGPSENNSRPARVNGKFPMT